MGLLKAAGNDDPGGGRVFGQYAVPAIVEGSSGSCATGVGAFMYSSGSRTCATRPAARSANGPIAECARAGAGISRMRGFLPITRACRQVRQRAEDGQARAGSVPVTARHDLQTDTARPDTLWHLPRQGSSFLRVRRRSADPGSDTP